MVTVDPLPNEVVTSLPEAVLGGSNIFATNASPIPPAKAVCKAPSVVGKFAESVKSAT